MNKISQIFWGRVESSTKLDESIFPYYKQILLGTFLLLFMSTLGYYGDLPHLLYDPPRLSLMNFWSSFPASEFILFLELLLIVLILLLLLDIKPIICGVLLAVVMILYNGIGYTLGKVDHAIMMPLTIFVMSLAGWKGKRLFNIPPESLLAVLLSFGMFTAGIQKMIYWVDFDTSTNGFLSWYVNGYYNYGRTHMLADYVLGWPLWIYELADYAAVFLELTPFIVLMIGKKWLWKMWLLIVAIFHVANLLFLNISFEYHTVIYLLYFMSVVPTGWLKNQLVTLGLVTVAVVQIVGITFFSSTIFDSLFYHNSARLWFFLAVWVLVIFVGINSMKRDLRNS